MKLAYLVLILGLIALPSGLAQTTAIADNGQQITISNNGGKITTSGSGVLVTTFNSDNAYSGNMFDIMPKTLVRFKALDVNVDAPVGDTVHIDVWYKKGTCQGFEEAPSYWTLLGSGTGVSAGADKPTFIDFSTNKKDFYPECGSIQGVYGIFVDYTNYSPSTGVLRYTNGVNTYSNNDLKLVTYCGKGDGWKHSFYYRTWNGAFYYDTPQYGLSIYPYQYEITKPMPIQYFLMPGAAFANRNYLIFASITGTSPGVNLPGGVNLPINWDMVTNLFIKICTTPIFTNFMGTMESDGNMTAVWNSHIYPIPPTALGLVFNFAYAIEPSGPSTPWFTSNPVPLIIKQ